ncbi:hypothetical protein QQ045_014389 [Rhodiola kirilowii]
MVDLPDMCPVDSLLESLLTDLRNKAASGSLRKVRGQPQTQALWTMWEQRELHEGDVSLASCRVCVNFAMVDLPDMCPVDSLLESVRGKRESEDDSNLCGEEDMNSAESLQFELRTNNFLNDILLGCGGFGSVYMGKLADEQEIAVKRLAENSGQGDIEFNNEIQLLAKLQHGNLVKLLGFCLQGQERLFSYTSLCPMQALFNDPKRTNLDWNM